MIKILILLFIAFSINAEAIEPSTHISYTEQDSSEFRYLYEISGVGGDVELGSPVSVWIHSANGDSIAGFQQIHRWSDADLIKLRAYLSPICVFGNDSISVRDVE